MIITFCSFIFNLFISNANVGDALGVQGPLTFNKISFDLAESTKIDEKVYVQSYLPKNETMENFNQKLSILIIDTDKEIEEVVLKKTKDLAELKKIDHNTSFSSREINSGKEYILEYTTCEYANKKLNLVEYNVSKIHRIKTLSGKNAVMIYTYSWRSYEDETTLFLSTLDRFKEEFIADMTHTPVPAVHWR